MGDSDRRCSLTRTGRGPTVERLLWIFVVVVLLLVGVVVFASSAGEPTEFGWFAYAPEESPEPRATHCS